MLDQRQGLRIVHDYKIVIEKSADTVFVNDLLVNFLFDFREIDLRALQRVMHLLRDREKIGCPLNDPPFGPQTQTIHQQRDG